MSTNYEKTLVQFYFFTEVLEQMKRLGHHYNELYDLSEDEFLIALVPYAQAIKTHFMMGNLTVLNLLELIPSLAEQFWHIHDIQDFDETTLLPDLDHFELDVRRILELNTESPDSTYVITGNIEGEEEELCLVKAKDGYCAEDKFKRWLRDVGDFEDGKEIYITNLQNLEDLQQVALK